MIVVVVFLVVVVFVKISLRLMEDQESPLRLTRYVSEKLISIVISSLDLRSQTLYEIGVFNHFCLVCIRTTVGKGNKLT